MSRLLAYRHNIIRFIAPSRSFFGSTEKVDIEITNRAGTVHQIKARVGDTLLDTVLNEAIEVEGFGVCGGGVACSTCHIVLDQSTYDKSDRESDEEWDMLENANGLTHTSRLGCCIKVRKNMENAVIKIPHGSDARWKV